MVLFRYFNSIKVRLELDGEREITGVNGFQFHKGTIRTVISITSFLLFANFNSIKVRLERRTSHLALQRILYFNSIKVRLELLKVDGKIESHKISIP